MKSIENSKKKNIDLLKYTLFFFAFVVLYNFLIVNRCQFWNFNAITYTYHLVDYSFGFATRLLPGAIYHLFFKEVFPVQLTVYLTVCVLVLFLLVAFLLSKVILSQQSLSSRRTVSVIALFTLSGPCSFAIFTRLLGMIDMYLVLFATLALVFFYNKYLKYSLPILLVGMLLVHTVSLISYFILFFIIIAYEIVSAKGKCRKPYLIIAVSSFFCVAVLLLLLAKFERSSLTYTLEEFNAELERRNHYDQSVYTVYYDYFFYDFYESAKYSFAQAQAVKLISSESNWLPVFVVEFINKFYSIWIFENNLYHSYPQFYWQFVLLIALLMPLLVMFYSYWLIKAKTSPTKKKWIFFAVMLQFPISLLGCFFSADISRMMTHAFLTQSALFFYFLNKEKEDLTVVFQESSVMHLLIVLFYFVVYALIYVNPYQ